jgi:predicted transcriptional regulator
MKHPGSSVQHLEAYPSGPFVLVPEAALRLPSSQFQMICILCKLAEAPVSYATLASLCGKSRSTVIRAMAGLIERGWVKREANATDEGLNRFSVVGAPDSGEVVA